MPLGNGPISDKGIIVLQYLWVLPMDSSLASEVFWEVSAETS